MGGCRTLFDEEWHELSLCKYSQAKQVVEREMVRACCMHVRDKSAGFNRKLGETTWKFYCRWEGVTKMNPKYSGLIHGLNLSASRQGLVTGFKDCNNEL